MAVRAKDQQIASWQRRYVDQARDPSKDNIVIAVKNSNMSTLSFLHQPWPQEALQKKPTRFHKCSAPNPLGLPGKLKIAPTTLSKITGNSSTASLAILLNVSARLLICFGGEHPEAAGPHPPLTTPIIASTMVKMVIKRAENSNTIV